MIRAISTLALVCASFLAVSARTVSAHSSTPAMAHVIVQLKGSPLATDTALKRVSRATLGHFRLDPSLPAARWYSGALESYQNQEIRYLKNRGIDLQVGYRMHVVLNGFTAILPQSQVSQLQSAPNVVEVAPQHRIRPELDRAVPLVNAPAAWASLGGGPSAGRGMLIADIDSGIDITNPCFSDKNMPPPPFRPRSDTAADAKFVNNKVIVARAFGSGGPSKRYSAKDVVGHGSWTASIEACDYNTQTPAGARISGMAPAAYLMSYNVFPKGDDGLGPYDPLVAALEAAVLDGADVINMSIGSGGGQGLARLDQDEQAVENAVHAGVPVVISAANTGPTSQTVSSPAGAPDAIAVGSSTNSGAYFTNVEVNGPGQVPAALTKIQSVEGSATFTNSVGPATVVPVGYGRVPGDDAIDKKANDFAGKDLNGKIALIERGSPTGSAIRTSTKLINSEKHGAIGAIVYDSNPTNPRLIEFSEGKSNLPMMFISNASGNALLDWVTAHPDTTVTMDAALTLQSTPADVLSQYSATGPLGGYAIKPDLVAPGQSVYGAAESEDPTGEVYSPDGFVSADGTSASAPMVTGAAALLLQGRPRATPAEIKALLMETSNTSVYVDNDHSQIASVQQMGAGRLDVGAAFAAHADVLPQSLSFGAVNDGAAAVHQASSLTLSDLGGGSGTWQVSVHSLHSATGVSVSVPSTTSVSAGGRATFSVTLDVAHGVGAGDFDGIVILTNGTDSLHVPYFVHVSSVVIKPQSILLVDDTTSRYVPEEPDVHTPPVQHVDVTHYYVDALNAIHRPYTYWDEAKQGSPTVQDMKQASAVIFFTGANLNSVGKDANPNGVNAPIGPIDEQVIDDYLHQGGRIFLTGKGAAMSAAIDVLWTAVDFGAVATSLSVFDTPINDPGNFGGIAPPKPSVAPRLGAGALSRVGPFAGLKPLDLSNKGNGAQTNLAEYNPDLQLLIGVPALKAFSGRVRGVGTLYGRPALVTTSKKLIQRNVAVVDSDEPSLTHSATYTGRSVLFAFGFEGINNNTGYATRAQVLQRVLQWLDDTPSATVGTRQFRAGIRSTLTARLHAASPDRAGAYTWQIGSRTIAETGGPSHFTFSHSGTYRVRVQITDTLGHQAVSPWVRVSVR